MKMRKRFSLFLSRWKVIILCFVFSLSLYVAVYFSGRAERDVLMPLEVVLPQGFEASSLLPKEARIIIKGREREIYMIDVTKLRLYADFSDVDKKGVASTPVMIDYKDMMEYVNLSDLSIFTNPSVVKIYFD